MEPKRRRPGAVNWLISDNRRGRGRRSGPAARRPRARTGWPTRRPKSRRRWPNRNSSRPGEPFDIGKLKGKHVWIITSTMAVPFVATIAHGVEAAAKVAGIETTLFDGKGDVSQWNRGMSQAVAQHADGIVTIGASPELMKGPTGEALKQKIPVVDAVTADKTAPLVPGTFAHVSISFYHSGQLQADYAIARSGGTAHVLILGDNEFPGEVSRVEGMQKEFSTLCPKCAVTVQDTQVGNLGVKLGQLTQTLLRRSPDITMVLPTYDAQAIYVVPAIKSANF